MIQSFSRAFLVIVLCLIGHTLLYFLRIIESNSATDASKSDPVNNSIRSCLDKLSGNKARVSSLITLYSTVFFTLSCSKKFVKKAKNGQWSDITNVKTPANLLYGLETKMLSTRVWDWSVILVGIIINGVNR